MLHFGIQRVSKKIGRCMKKLGWKMILLIVLAAIVFLWLIKAPIMASYLTKKMRVPVSIGRISMWPSSTTIHNFKVTNPRGFKTRTAFQADKIQMNYQFDHLVGDPSEIDQILINDIFLSIEFSNPLGTQNNWTKISERMPKQKSQKNVIVHKLILTNMAVEIRGLGFIGKPQTRHIERLEFDEISSEKGFPTEQLVSAIFGGAGLRQYIEDAFNPAKTIEKFLNPFKGLGGESEAPAEEEKAEEEAI